MIRILLADDEPKIRRGLRRRIEKMDLAFTICGEAENGKEALALAKNTNPHIVIADICMPILGGLELIEGLRSLEASPHVIVVSGHDEFKYAQRSLELKVHSYLLKPIGEGKLEQILTSLFDLVHKETEDTKSMNRIMHQIEQSRTYLCALFLRSWIAGEISPGDAYEQLCDFGLNFESTGIAHITGGNDWQAMHGEIQNHMSMLNIASSDFFFFKDTDKSLLGLYRCEDDCSKAIASIENHLSVCMDRQIIMHTRCVDKKESLSDAMRALRERSASLKTLSPVVHAAWRHIQAHYGEEELCLGEVAKIVGINPTYLSRLMKQELDMSFQECLISERINKALVLMQEGYTKVKEIAKRVGYDNPLYFSAVFKSKTGMSPSHYLKEVYSYGEN